MEGDGFLTDILLNGGDGDVAGLDDLNFPITQDTQSIHDLPSEVQEVHVEVQPSRSPKGSKRTKKFHYKEDEVVCSGWLNVSKDPINGANQSRSTFWSRVHAFFEKHKKTAVLRTESSIMHMWLTIQFQVNKYCSCYEAIERRNQSGTTIQDKISQASKMYQELDKDNKSFTLIHCWNILKEEDKWKAKRIELAELEKPASKKKQKSTKVSRPRDVEAPNNEEVIEVVALETEARRRPQGIKKAKEALRRGGGEACMEALDKMWAKKEAFDKEKEKAKQERFMASLELEKKRVSNEEKKAEADLIKQEKEIMSIDITSLNPLQRQYYETM
ncbi:glutathione S-transferase T3-like [Miscanthus floridulus]|uniref:glutathione S-transferase T3-like n=1 Tax=Miscanthus floridulus TaxID=154761 RepID=UPI00345A795B